MQEQNWNEKMRALLTNRKWDMKDWRRATKFDQHAIENLLNTDTTGLPWENLEAIYEATKKAKLDRKNLDGKTLLVGLFRKRHGEVVSDHSDTIFHDLI